MIDLSEFYTRTAGNRWLESTIKSMIKSIKELKSGTIDIEDYDKLKSQIGKLDRNLDSVTRNNLIDFLGAAKVVYNSKDTKIILLRKFKKWLDRNKPSSETEDNKKGQEGEKPGKDSQTTEEDKEDSKKSKEEGSTLDKDKKEEKQQKEPKSEVKQTKNEDAVSDVDQKYEKGTVGHYINELEKAIYSEFKKFENGGKVTEFLSPSEAREFKKIIKEKKINKKNEAINEYKLSIRNKIKSIKKKFDDEELNSSNEEYLDKLGIEIFELSKYYNLEKLKNAVPGIEIGSSKVTIVNQALAVTDVSEDLKLTLKFLTIFDAAMILTWVYRSVTIQDIKNKIKSSVSILRNEMSGIVGSVNSLLSYGPVRKLKLDDDGKIELKDLKNPKSNREILRLKFKILKSSNIKNMNDIIKGAGYYLKMYRKHVEDFEDSIVEFADSQDNNSGNNTKSDMEILYGILNKFVKRDARLPFTFDQKLGSVVKSVIAVINDNINEIANSRIESYRKSSIKIDTEKVERKKDNNISRAKEISKEPSVNTPFSAEDIPSLSENIGTPSHTVSRP